MKKITNDGLKLWIVSFLASGILVGGAALILMICERTRILWIIWDWVLAHFTETAFVGIFLIFAVGLHKQLAELIESKKKEGKQ